MNQDDMQGLPPRLGTAGEASPEAARQWLDQWRTIGGGITIDTHRRINPWRFTPASTTAIRRQLEDSLQTELLRELDETPGLATAVRAVASNEAFVQLRRAVTDMEKEPFK